MILKDSASACVWASLGATRARMQTCFFLLGSLFLFESYVVSCGRRVMIYARTTAAFSAWMITIPSLSQLSREDSMFLPLIFVSALRQEKVSTGAAFNMRTSIFRMRTCTVDLNPGLFHSEGKL